MIAGCRIYQLPGCNIEVGVDYEIEDGKVRFESATIDDEDFPCEMFLCVDGKINLQQYFQNLLNKDASEILSDALDQTCCDAAEFRNA